MCVYVSVRTSTDEYSSSIVVFCMFMSTCVAVEVVVAVVVIPDVGYVYMYYQQWRSFDESSLSLIELKEKQCILIIHSTFNFATFTLTGSITCISGVISRLAE